MLTSKQNKAQEKKNPLADLGTLQTCSNTLLCSCNWQLQTTENCRQTTGCYARCLPSCPDIFVVPLGRVLWVSALTSVIIQDWYTTHSGEIRSAVHSLPIKRRPWGLLSAGEGQQERPHLTSETDHQCNWGYIGCGRLSPAPVTSASLSCSQTNVHTYVHSCIQMTKLQGVNTHTLSVNSKT